MRLKELCSLIGGKTIGNDNIIISGINNLECAKEGEISFIIDKKNLAEAKKSNASAFLVEEEINELNKPQIVVKNVKLSYAKVIRIFHKELDKCGIHPTAIIGNGVKFGKDVFIGSHCFIGDNVVIGDNVKIFPLVYIGEDVSISDNTIIYPHVVVREKTIIGKNVILHSGVVIGEDGFGYTPDENKKHFKILQTGNVIIKDDVEIGANTCIDRATFGSTKIGCGTKIDNLVQIAHNVTIGEDCIIVSQVGISGSVNIGDRCILAGQVGVKDHINIGSDSIILGRAGVTKDVPEKSIYYGMPAGPHIEQKRLEALIRKLPEIYEKVKKIIK